ncbi:MAG: thiamine pyrophosphate-dependent enzyme, partial [Actinobacteria bacterium]|nr:thiamine pyrophosphate-dependent enzyme [Actinomycetota bacterium]
YDLDQYRDKKEHASWLLRDPITNFVNKLIKEGIADQEELNRYNEEIKNEVKKAVEFAEGSAFPDPKELYEDVYK